MELYICTSVHCVWHRVVLFLILVGRKTEIFTCILKSLLVFCISFIVLFIQTIAAVQTDLSPVHGACGSIYRCTHVDIWYVHVRQYMTPDSNATQHARFVQHVASVYIGRQ